MVRPMLPPAKMAKAFRAARARNAADTYNDSSNNNQPASTGLSLAEARQVVKFLYVCVCQLVC